MNRSFLMLFATLAIAVALVAIPLRAAAGEDAGFGPVTKPLTGDGVALQVKKGFGAEFWLVDYAQTLPKWISGDVRNITPLSVVKRGQVLRLIVFLSNPGSAPLSASRSGDLYSDVTYDVLLHRPDRARYVGATRVAAWSGPAPPPYLVQTAKPTLKIIFKPSEPLGEYTIMVVVHDNVRKVSIPIIHTLTVQE